MKNVILTLIVFVTLCTSLDARHIISGTMGYECLGNDNYRIKMVIFRDCNGGGASFDSPANFSLYNRQSGVLEQQVTAEPIITQVDEYLDPSCPPGIEMQCLQRGEYEFVVFIPMNTDDYYVSYQRCCWSNDILNIESPTENGITITTELTSYARSLCNSTDIIDAPMAFTACPGVETTIEFPQTDSEGDSLFYSLCLPYNGGGVDGSAGNPGDPNGVSGVQPIPVSPEAYTELEYAIGFDEDNPFPTENGVTFATDSSSFSFTPSTLGYYLVSYCVTEVRNGQVLGQYRMNARGASLDIVDSNTSLYDQFGLRVWYNAENSSFMLHSQSVLENANINVYNTSGELINKHQLSNNNGLEIEANYPKGIYILSIESNGISQNFKIPVY